MKNILTLLLLLIIVVSLTGCSGRTEESHENTSAESNVSTPQEQISKPEDSSAENSSSEPTVNLVKKEEAGTLLSVPASS